ncbi:MAG: YjjG family noncanonical pyrimidine nucleotidase [Candidatus Eisenbacteria bacterium]|uniref:YjjG family noncanonical pyrimidine nucleotidase n=1 Tax=Eiseniibacteriota bacterium TaxID=2212470 RepID=A0A956RQ13_UNCEI|nr:YjjG family noncanonical pyrimidine nucleotidase [Candidatus Eisenbacteria bacterium]
MSRYRWIIFDADNTLFDFDRAERSALVRTLAAFALPYDDEVHARYTAISARLWKAFEAGEISSPRLRVARFEQLLESIDADPEPVSERYLTELGTQADLFPESEHVVRTLAATHRLMLATNGIADVQRARFRIASIRDCFHDVVISDEIGVAKPQAAFFDETFRRMGHPAKESVLMVGDSLSSDIAGGHGYGIDTCWLDRGRGPEDPEPAPTYRIRHIDELHPLLDAL